MTSPNDPRPKRSPRRLRLQFGLRSLMVVVLVICIVLGFHVERVRRQREAVAVLMEAGAMVKYYPRHADLGELEDGLEKPHGIREWIEWSAPQRLRNALGIDFFRCVYRVDFDYNSADFPSSLERLRDLPGLSELELHFASNEDLDQVCALGELTSLDLSDSVIDDEGLARIGRLRKLESLRLLFDDRGPKTQWRQPITDAGLARLSKLRRLKHLDLSESAISGAGLRHLAEMSDLGSLNVGCTGVTDEGLASLRALTKLGVLDLRETAITDRGLRVLGEIPSLELIYISDTAATSDGAAWLKRRLTNASISFSHKFLDAQYITLNRARVQMRAGRWRQAVEALNAPDASSLEPVERMYYLGWCHAELGQWDQAEREFCEALEQLVRRWTEFRMSRYSTGMVWARIYEFPQVFERVARARPNDVWRWATPAQHAVLEGRWSSAAADYSHAMECEQIWKHAYLIFEYGVSRLLVGDHSGHRRICARLLENERRLAASLPKDGSDSSYYFSAGYLGSTATRISCVAPQGPLAVDREPRITLQGDLLPLAYFRTAQFEKVLEQKRPIQGGGGVFLFSRAMAYQRLGRSARARECFAQGAHWLERRMKDDCIRGDQSDAGDFLQTEALRREAERLIFNSGADKHF